MGLFDIFLEKPLKTLTWATLISLANLLFNMITVVFNKTVFICFHLFSIITRKERNKTLKAAKKTRKINAVIKYVF